MFSKIFFLGLEKKATHPEVRKIVLLNILLTMSIFYLSFFSLYNYFILKVNEIALIDFLVLLLVIYTYIDLYKTKRVQRASAIITFSSFTLFTFIIFFKEAQNFSLAWSIFLPVFVIFLNGSKKGIIITTLFYTIVFSMAFMGIGEWLDGKWNYISYLRFVAINIGLTAIIYFFQRSFEIADRELLLNRKQEERYIKELEHASVTDPLTQLYNRRYLKYFFNLEFDKAKKYKSYLALFILDLDYFKDYNDTYGHIAGDKVLQSVAQILKDALRRESDNAFRVGGEEFCGLVMFNDYSKVVKTIEYIRGKIESLEIEHEKSPYKKVTASFGVCTIHSYNKKDLDAMYKIADDALYEAKRTGKNTLCGQDRISTL